MFTKLAYIYGMKYLNGKIYKLIDNTNGNIYIGSTCLSLKERLGNHKKHYNEYIKTDVKRTTSYNIIKNNDYKIELLENFPCKSKQELLNKEREYIQNNKCLNMYRPILTNQEKLDYKKEWKKKNYIDNRDKLIIQQKKIYKKNRDEILERCKIYYEANKDKINKRKRENIQCDICNNTISKNYLSQHKKTLKCKNYKKDNIN